MTQASSNIAPATSSDKAETAIGSAMANATPRRNKPAAAAKPVRQMAPQTARAIVTFITAERECPDATMANNISRVFGMNPVDYDAIRDMTRQQFEQSAAILADNLSEKALEMHMQRIVDAFVRSAHGAGTFYQTKAKTARDLNSRIANEDRDEDRMGVDGGANRAARAREFAGQMALQAFALLAAADGAIEGYKEATGSDWKPYEGSTPNPAGSVTRQAADAQMAALGM